MKGYGTVGAVALFVLCFGLFVHEIEAQSIPRGLGHPDASFPDPYDPTCCSRQDCEPVEDGAVIDTGTGYQIRYLTSRGFIASGFLKYDDKRIKKSIDFEHDHVCARRPYTDPEGAILCFHPKPRGM